MGRHHMEPLYTRIADRDVLVEQGLRTSVYFSEGCKPEDAEGFYEFWTLENKEGKVQTGRLLAGEDPGKRFRDMENKSDYEEAWADAQTAVRVLPSSRDRLKKWLNNPDHAGGAPCAKYGEVNGQPIRIGRHPVDGHYIIEATTSPGNEDDRK